MERQLYVPALILLGDFQRAGAGLIGACTGVGQVFCAVPDRRQVAPPSVEASNVKAMRPANKAERPKA